jgi:hypothetical protein
LSFLSPSLWHCDTIFGNYDCCQYLIEQAFRHRCWAKFGLPPAMMRNYSVVPQDVEIATVNLPNKTGHTGTGVGRPTVSSAVAWAQVERFSVPIDSVWRVRYSRDWLADHRAFPVFEEDQCMKEGGTHFTGIHEDFFSYNHGLSTEWQYPDRCSSESSSAGSLSFNT